MKWHLSFLHLISPNMIKKSTQNYLLQYIYNELSYPDRIEVAANVAVDADLKMIYHRFDAAKKSLNKTIVSPSNLALKNVLAYSRASI